MNIQLDDIRADITRAVQIALEEDIGSGDITALLIPEDKESTAEVITREDCVICGTAWFDEVFKQLGGIESITWHVKDGDDVSANTKLVTLKGNARKLLTGERSALNFLQLLSGTATKSREYAKLVEGTDIKILDTRKTIPGLRTAQKYAVAIGGCHNHRIGLYDAFLIKENHIAACGGIKQAVEKAREIAPDKLVEVEVENLEELEKAVEAAVDVVMLDNFEDRNIARAVEICAGNVKIEISGNMDQRKILNSPLTSLTFLSSGNLTKNISAIDFSMRF